MFNPFKNIRRRGSTDATAAVQPTPQVPVESAVRFAGPKSESNESRIGDLQTALVQFRQQYDPLLRADKFNLGEHQIARGQDGSVSISASVCADILERFLNDQAVVEAKSANQAVVPEPAQKVVSFRTTYLRRRLTRQTTDNDTKVIASLLSLELFGPKFSAHVEVWNVNGAKGAHMANMVSHNELVGVCTQAQASFARIFEVAVLDTSETPDPQPWAHQLIRWLSVDFGSELEEPFRNRLREVLQRNFPDDKAATSLMSSTSEAWLETNADLIPKIVEPFGLDDTFDSSDVQSKAALLHRIWVGQGGIEQMVHNACRPMDRVWRSYLSPKYLEDYDRSTRVMQSEGVHVDDVYLSTAQLESAYDKNENTALGELAHLLEAVLHLQLTHDKNGRCGRFMEGPFVDGLDHHDD